MNERTHTNAWFSIAYLAVCNEMNTQFITRMVLQKNQFMPNSVGTLFLDTVQGTKMIYCTIFQKLNLFPYTGRRRRQGQLKKYSMSMTILCHCQK